MASGSLTITNVTGTGPYTVTVSNSTGVTNGDHLLSELGDSAGTDAIWTITTVVDGTTLTVTDDITEGNGGSAYGAPVAGAAYYATPGTGLGVTLGPEGSTGWRALVLRNAELLDDLLTETGTQALTLGAISDNQLIVRSGTTLIGRTSYTVHQVVESVEEDNVTCSTAFNLDDTIPLIAEGTAVLTRSITPVSATSILLVEASVTMNGTGPFAIALFNDGDTCVAATLDGQSVDSTFASLTAAYQVASGGTSAQTFKLRAGKAGAGTVYVNSNGGTRVFGGAVIKTFLRITEYRPS